MMETKKALPGGEKGFRSVYYNTSHLTPMSE